MIYALTGTFATSILIYRGPFADPTQLDDGERVEVPTAFADVADPLVPTPPRSLVDKAFRVVRWKNPAPADILRRSPRLRSDGCSSLAPPQTVKEIDLRALDSASNIVTEGFEALHAGPKMKVLVDPAA